MDGDEDWMMRPIIAQLLPYKALDDSSYSLEDFVFCCEALEVQGENQLRLRAASK